MLKPILQEWIITVISPFTRRELLGWGKVYKIFVGGLERNNFWQSLKRRTITGKLHFFKMELDLSHWSDRMTFFLGRWYDLATQILIKDILKQGDVVIDIGANIGNFTLTARHLVGEQGKIFAFEPNPSVRNRLNHHLKINHIQNVTVHPFGLSEIEGKMTLFVPYINAGEGSLGCFTESEYQAKDFAEVPVDIKVGDEILKDTAPRLIKIDVEGAEVKVLAGLTTLISKYKPIIIAEYVPQHLKRFDHAFGDIFEFAKRHGYQIFRLGLVKKAGNTQLALSQIDTPNFNEPCDIMLCHPNDVYITKINAILA